jgi:hypothetical protein
MYQKLKNIATRLKYEGRFFEYIGKISYVIFIIAFIASCKSIQYVPVESVKTEYINSNTVDSILIRDSIYINRYQTNDTVYLYTYKDKLLYRNIIQVDTILKIDSIQVAYPVQVETIKYKSFWYDITIRYVCLILILLLFIYIIIKKIT